MKIILTIAITCVVTAIGAGVLWVRAGRDGTKDQGTSVRVEKPSRGDLVEVVSASGTIEPKTQVSISARVSALIRELPFREGQAVTRGDPKADPLVPASVLVRLDDKDLQAALRAAESRRLSQAAQLEVSRKRLITQQATIDSIRASLEDATRTLAREQKLLETKVSAQATVDTAKCTVDKLQADMTAAVNNLKADEMNLEAMQYDLAAIEANAALCRDNLAYTVINSPIDGVVTRVNAEVGEMAITGTMNNPGTEILQVADLSTMLLLAEVDEAYVGNIQPGQKAQVRVQAYGDRTFEGTVDSVALVNSLSRSYSKYFETRIAVQSDGRRILSGLTADVDIQTRRHERVLKVPSQAVLGRRADDLPSNIRDGNANVPAGKTEIPVVYRFIDGKAVATPVTIGSADATCTEIVSGLTDDDRVIVGPYKVLEGVHHEQKVHDDRQADSAPATCPTTTTAPAKPKQ